MLRKITAAFAVCAALFTGCTAQDKAEEAMALLKKVTEHGANRWSAVYDLEKFSVEVCFNEDFSKSYAY